RTTLFAVAAADTIILNLWAHDVGRGEGEGQGSPSLLQSVFQEVVRL
ncbi:unnamed protein product, partial [Discosporangium mesarthrocarpum]